MMPIDCPEVARAESDRSEAKRGGVIHTTALGSIGHAYASAKDSHAIDRGSEIKTQAISGEEKLPSVTIPASSSNPYLLSSSFGPTHASAVGGSASLSGQSTTVAQSAQTITNIHHHYSFAGTTEEKILSAEEREVLRKMHFNLPQVAEYFLPTTHVEKLKKLFDEGATKVAITGVAGSGKTELAKAYAHSISVSAVSESKEIAGDAKNARLSHPTIWYLETDTPVLENTLWNLAKVLNLPLRLDQESWQAYFKRVRGLLPKAFEAYPYSFLILNNVVDYASLEPFLDVLEGLPIRLLVTTQQREFFTIQRTASNLEIGAGLSVTEGAELLRKIVPNVEASGIETLVREVEGSPLALSLIGLCMLKEGMVRAKDYQEQAKTAYAPLRLEMEKVARHRPVYKQAIHQVLMASILKVANHVDGFELLLFASLLHPERIERKFFKDYFEEKYANAGEKVLFECLELMKTYGLLKLEGGKLAERYYEMHRSVQAEVRYYYASLKLSSAVSPALGTAVRETKNTEFIQNTPNKLPDTLRRMLRVLHQHLPESLLKFPLKAAPSVLHLEHVLSHIVSLLGDVKDEIVAEAYSKVAMAYRHQGGTTLLTRALLYAQKALEIRKKIFGEFHDDVAESLSQLGFIYYNLRGQANLEKARQYHEQALTMQKVVLGEQHCDVADSLGNLGNVHLELGGQANLEKARQYYEDALEIRKTVLGVKHADVACSLDALGLVYTNLGGLKNLEYAQCYHEKALGMRKAVLGEQHCDVADSLGNLGNVYCDVGGQANLRRAYDCYKKALGIQKVILGEKHPVVATLLNNLGIVSRQLRGQANLEQARRYHEHALEMRKVLLGEQHPDIAASLLNLGNVYLDIGGRANLEKARSYCQQALDLLAEGEPGRANVLDSLGDTYTQLGGRGNLEQARRYHEEALEIEKALLGEQNLDVADTYNGLGTVYCKLGGRENLEQARKYHEDALKIQQALFEQHPEIAESLSGLGTAYCELGGQANLVRALKYHEEAWEMRKMLFSEDHHEVADSLNHLGLVFYKLGGKSNLQKGLDYCQRALVIQEAQWGHEHLKTVETRESLVLIQSKLKVFKLKAVFAVSLTAVGFFATGGIGGLAAGAVVGVGAPTVVERARTCCRSRTKRD